MKRMLPTMFLVLVAALVVLIIIVATRGSSPRDAALSRYLTYFNPIAQGVRVASFVHATHPTKFTAEMSGPVVGSSSFYRTDVRYSGDANGSGLRPLPYPSSDVSCALLTGSTNKQWIVFVVLHEDMYNADWLVHEARTSWPNDELRATLDAIGCSEATQ